ncbi:hypothetical protein Tco_1308577, partial [Tanacetum coccineum]
LRKNGEPLIEMIEDNVDHELDHLFVYEEILGLLQWYIHASSAAELSVPKNSFEVLKVLKNSLEALKVLENNLESMKLQEN